MDLVVSDPKNGKTVQLELDKEKEAMLFGKRVGEQFDGGIAGLEGYSLQITGGTDKDGFAMRPEVPGTRKMTLVILASKKKASREKRKKTVRGNTVSAETAQLNAKVVTAGPKALEEIVPSKPKEGKEKKEEAAPKAAKKK